MVPLIPIATSLLALSGTGGDGTVQASGLPSCSVTKIQTRRVKKYGVDSSTGYDFRVAGRVYIKRPGKLSHCRLKVCLGEELGAGNWYGSWCNNWNPVKGVHRYDSLAPYVKCSDYRGTGSFRSYARFEDGGVTKLGLERKLC